MQINEFNFIFVWIVREGKERNGINFCLHRNKKRMERNVIKYIVNKLELHLELWVTIH